MRCLEAAFVMLLGWVFYFRKYRPSFRKKKKKNYFENCRLFIRFVMFCFKNYAKLPLRKKSKIQMMTRKQLKQGRMQTLDNNFEMIKKAYV